MILIFLGVVILELYFLSVDKKRDEAIYELIRNDKRVLERFRQMDGHSVAQALEELRNDR